MNFLSEYQDIIQRQGYASDEAQYSAVLALDKVYQTLLTTNAQRYTLLSIFSNLMTGSGNHAFRGCYLWGGVGRGKTFLMDMFYNALVSGSKARFHFNHFMQLIHNMLNEFKGKKDPLKFAAIKIASSYRVICLDEFHVTDITDAMLLYGLFQALYSHDVVMVMTSNVPPDELYKNGLQRSRFIPAIELIKQKNNIVHVGGEKDYRIDCSASNESYYSPLNKQTDELLHQKFLDMALGGVSSLQFLEVKGRLIETRMISDNAVWFDFENICSGPRAASDYIEIANRYKIVFISNIYVMTSLHDDVARRFIYLIDEFYDREIQLFISATRLPAYLYTGDRLHFEFQRTISRLEEMRTKNYHGQDYVNNREDYIGSKA